MPFNSKPIVVEGLFKQRLSDDQTQVVTQNCEP